jgi:hypothetical protein
MKCDIVFHIFLCRQVIYGTQLVSKILKVRQFQNEFMKSLVFPQNTNKKLSGFLPCVVRAKLRN